MTGVQTCALPISLPGGVSKLLWRCADHYFPFTPTIVEFIVDVVLTFASFKIDSFFSFVGQSSNTPRYLIIMAPRETGDFGNWKDSGSTGSTIDINLYTE